MSPFAFKEDGMSFLEVMPLFSPFDTAQGIS